MAGGRRRIGRRRRRLRQGQKVYVEALLPHHAVSLGQRESLRMIFFAAVRRGAAQLLLLLLLLLLQLIRLYCTPLPYVIPAANVRVNK
jgi:hypothetical protein